LYAIVPGRVRQGQQQCRALDACQRLKFGATAVDTCDVVIVGGGPAGSACAWRLRQAGLEVVVVDKALFPRDKVCAGWITPQVLDELQIDSDDYRDGRTFQPITDFRTGVIGEDHVVDTSYGRPVSFGIRRCEFDDYLLRRSGARLLLGTSISIIRRAGAQWIVNNAVRARMLVGAGGHFCPVSRMLNGGSDRGPVVAAREVELPIDQCVCEVAAKRPELYFCPDLAGYGWCFRKGDYVNVGLGRLDPHALPHATADFLDFLRITRGISLDASSPRWRGHAYLLSGTPQRRAVDDAVMLVGDAAGLAYPQSGEGIRPAIESGLMAASTILEANGHYTRDRLEPYARHLEQRFGDGPLAHLLSRVVPTGIPSALALRLLDTSWFARRVVLDQWFLHVRDVPFAGV
jgi:geranylgeranyl reductase family protein